MDKTESKPVRFSVLLRERGRPELVTLWGGPRHDKEFNRALAEKRVLSVRQKSGSRKDFGTIGFSKENHAAYLVFPQSLADYEGKRVVGIKYDLLADAKPKGPVVKIKQTSPREQRPPQKQAALAKQFRVTFRSTATVELTRELEAENKMAAKEKALQTARDEPFDLARATKSQQLLRVEQIHGHNKYR